MFCSVLCCRVVVPQARCDNEQGWFPASLPCHNSELHAFYALDRLTAIRIGLHRPSTLIKDDLSTAGSLRPPAHHPPHKHLRRNRHQHIGTWQSSQHPSCASNSFQAWNLYNRLPTPTAKEFATQQKQQAEYVTLRRQLAATSAQNEFSKWAKLQRQVDKLTVQLEKQSTSHPPHPLVFGIA